MSKLPLIIAYVANILILIPVCYSMFFGAGVAAVFENRVVESEGLKLLVGSFWAAILLASGFGLVLPEFFAPVLLLQTFYKALWLYTFILPRIRAGNPWPIGISYCFLAIVLTYPFLFWFSYTGSH